MAGEEIKGVRRSNTIGCLGRTRIGLVPLLVTLIVMGLDVVGERYAGCACTQKKILENLRFTRSSPVENEKTYYEI